MGMTLGQRVRANIAADPEDEFFSSSVITEVLNEAQRELVRQLIRVERENRRGLRALDRFRRYTEVDLETAVAFGRYFKHPPVVLENFASLNYLEYLVSTDRIPLRELHGPYRQNLFYGNVVPTKNESYYEIDVRGYEAGSRRIKTWAFDPDVVITPTANEKSAGSITISSIKKKSSSLFTFQQRLATGSSTPGAKADVDFSSVDASLRIEFSTVGVAGNAWTVSFVDSNLATGIDVTTSGTAVTVTYNSLEGQTFASIIAAIESGVPQFDVTLTSGIGTELFELTSSNTPLSGGIDPTPAGDNTSTYSVTVSGTLISWTLNNRNVTNYTAQQHRDLALTAFNSTLPAGFSAAAVGTNQIRCTRVSETAMTLTSLVNDSNAAYTVDNVNPSLVNLASTSPVRLRKGTTVIASVLIAENDTPATLSGKITAAATHNDYTFTSVAAEIQVEAIEAGAEFDDTFYLESDSNEIDTTGTEAPAAGSYTAAPFSVSGGLDAAADSYVEFRSNVYGVERLYRRTYDDGVSLTENLIALATQINESGDSDYEVKCVYDQGCIFTATGKVYVTENDSDLELNFGSAITVDPAATITPVDYEPETIATSVHVHTYAAVTDAKLAVYYVAMPGYNYSGPTTTENTNYIEESETSIPWLNKFGEDAVVHYASYLLMVREQSQQADVHLGLFKNAITGAAQ